MHKKAAEMTEFKSIILVQIIPDQFDVIWLESNRIFVSFPMDLG
jgi:hypothetical protein